MNTKFNKQIIAIIFTFITLTLPCSAKIRPFGPIIQLRPVTIKNVAYASNGKSFAVPNFITAGSVGVIFVSEKGETGSIPSRFSEKSFIHASGIFYYYQEKAQSPSLAFIPLQELLSGYSVSYMPQSDSLAIAGTDKVLIYDAKSWRQIKSVTLSTNTTRALFSPDGSLLGVISGGKLYMLETRTYSLLYTISPEQNHQFADISFSGNSSRFALFEYKSTVLDHTSRIQIYESKTGNNDRTLPYFPDKITDVPGSHFPLLSYSPADSAIAVTIEKSFSSKISLVKSNDGALIREFKGNCHAFSPDGSMFSAGGKVYSTSDWKELGSHSNSAISVAFSPTERVILVVTPESMRRYRIE